MKPTILTLAVAMLVTFSQTDSSRANLNAPILVNPGVKGHAKKTVLIYYANETARSRRIDNVIGWLRGTDRPQQIDLARQIDKDLKQFTSAVDEEIATLKSHIHRRSQSYPLTVVFFTNRNVRRQRYEVISTGDNRATRSKLIMPTFDYEKYANYPLASPVVFESVLKKIAQRFSPRDHKFILITKSHGGRGYALASFNEKLSISSESKLREYSRRAAADKDGGRLDKGDGGRLDKSDGRLDKSDGRLDKTDGRLSCVGSKIGVTKDRYMATLAKMDAELGMKFSLVFIESCDSRLNRELVAGLQTRKANIGWLCTSDREGLGYKTLDYKDVFERGGKAASIADAIHQTLLHKYGEKNAER